jgi:hypothetical protein
MADLLLEQAFGDHHDVLADGQVVGYIMFSDGAPPGKPWMWTVAPGHHQGRIQAHGYADSRDTAMKAFAKSWQRE